jgi:hypothetical protein
MMPGTSFWWTNTASASGGYSSSVSGDVASAISQTIFAAPVSFLNSLDKIFQERGISSFAAVGAIGTAEDIRQKILAKILRIRMLPAHPENVAGIC